MTDQKTPDEFEISLRILGNEIVGMRLTSESKARNWAAFGIIATAILLALIVELMPRLAEIMQMMQ